MSLEHCIVSVGKKKEKKDSYNILEMYYFTFFWKRVLILLDEEIL